MLLIAYHFKDPLLFLLCIGKISLFLCVYLEERRLRDINISLLDKSRCEPIEHGKNKSSYLETVNVSIGTDNYLAPAEVVDIKVGKLLVSLGGNFNSAAEDFDKIGDYLTLEYF